VHQTGGLAQSFRIYHQPYLPNQKVDMMYDQNDATKFITTTTSFTYNSYGQVAETRKLTSNAATSDVERVRYVSDYVIPGTPADNATKAMALMKERNIFSPVVEQQQWVGNGSNTNDDKLIKSSLIKYRNFEVGGLQPEQLLTLRVQNPLTGYVSSSIGPNSTLVHNNAFEPKVNFIQYDALGNLREQKRHDGIPTTYLWGYSRSLPIAKIENASYPEVETALGTAVLADLEGNALADDQVRTKLAPLRSRASNMVTTYTYDPLTGVTSQTDPAGITTYYQYDEWGRLKLIRDQDQKIVKSYFYHYKQ
jgi:YD repeat-containing protein